MNAQHQLEAGFYHELPAGGQAILDRDPRDVAAEEASESASNDRVWRGVVGEPNQGSVQEIKPGDPDYFDFDLSHLNNGQRVQSGDDFDPVQNATPKWQDDHR